MTRTGRNEPCPCGSGRKYKHCCQAKEAAVLQEDLNWLRMNRTVEELVPRLMDHAERFYGPEAIAEAWDEFSLWRDIPMDPEAEPEIESIFLPWFLYNWEPDNVERDEAEELPGERIARHFLQMMGDRLDSFTRRFIGEASSREFSFHLVTGTVPGKELSLRDVLLKRDLTVHERQASAMVKPGNILLARIVTLDGDSIILGSAPYVIPGRYINDLIGMRERIAQHFPQIDHGVLLDYDIELREFYYDVREELLDPSPPQISNTDGEPLQLTTLEYELRCSPREAMDALLTLSLESDPAGFLEDGTFAEDGALVAIEIPWLKKGNRTHPEWDNTVLGHMSIDGDRLTVHVNSRERADKIGRKLNRRLGRRAELKSTVIDSPIAAMRDRARNGQPPLSASGNPEQEALNAAPEVQAVIREMARKHWKAWPDIALPALLGDTPRQAAKTGLGRERLEALLLDLDSRCLPEDAFRPDVAALRRELGLEPA